jgi:CRP-like cAMP-binding protein
MARPYVLYATVGSALLWGTTIASALTELGSDRLYYGLLVGSFLAAAATIALLALMVIKAQADRVVQEVRACAAQASTELRGAVAQASTELHGAVAQASDELHEAVAEMGKALTLDRETVAHAKLLMARLNASLPPVRGHDWAA